MKYYKRVLDVRPGDYECTLSLSFALARGLYNRERGLAQLHADRGPGGASQAVHYFRTALQPRPERGLA